MSARIAAAVELAGTGGSASDRLARAAVAVRAAKAAGASLVVLPEAYLPGYAHAAADAGPAARAWLEATARADDVTVAMGYLDHDRCVLGVTTPNGAHTAYTKRFLSPDEARAWRAGTHPVIVETPVGRLGLLVCADVLQLSAWDAYVGRVDAVLVAAAWPDYRDRITTIPGVARPALGWLFRDSNPYREALLARAAVAVGAPIVFANATGPYRGAEGFSGGSRIYGADGTVLAAGPLAVAPIVPGTPGAPLRHTPRWAAFTRVYRFAAAARARRNAPSGSA